MTATAPVAVLDPADIAQVRAREVAAAIMAEQARRRQQERAQRAAVARLRARTMIRTVALTAMGLLAVAAAVTVTG